MRTDRELIAAIIARDETACQELYEIYSEELRQSLVRTLRDTVAMEHGLVEGKTAAEFFAQVNLALNGLAMANMHYAIRRGDGPQEAVTDSFYVLARARRAQRPGMVFPRAVDSNHEQEPLVDIDSRLFVGLPANK
jgi:hypothetical protein